VTSTSRPGRTEAIFARDAQALAGEEQEDLAGARGFADAFGERLAFLAREQAPELVLAREDLVADLLQRIVALLDAAARPRRQRGARGGDGARGVVRARARERANDVAGVRRIDALGGVGAADPVAGDVVGMRFHDEGVLVSIGA